MRAIVAGVVRQIKTSPSILRRTWPARIGDSEAGHVWTERNLTVRAGFGRFPITEIPGFHGFICTSLWMQDGTLYVTSESPTAGSFGTLRQNGPGRSCRDNGLPDAPVYHLVADRATPRKVGRHIFLAFGMRHVTPVLADATRLLIPSDHHQQFNAQQSQSGAENHHCAEERAIS